MWGKLKHALQTIQQADKGTKKVWLIGMSGIMMIAVVGVWVWYAAARIEIVGIPHAEESADNTTVPATAKSAGATKPGIGKIFTTGIATIGASIKNTFFTDKTVTITKPNFQIESFRVTPVSLP